MHTHTHRQTGPYPGMHTHTQMGQDKHYRKWEKMGTVMGTINATTTLRNVWCISQLFCDSSISSKHTLVDTDIHTYVRMSVRMYVCVYQCMFVFVCGVHITYVCMYVGIFVTLVNMCMHTCTHTSTHTHHSPTVHGVSSFWSLRALFTWIQRP